MITIEAQMKYLTLFFIFSLLTISNGFASDNDINDAFFKYFKSSSLTPQETFHQIQSSDFESESYRFHFIHQSSDILKYEPAGFIEIQKVELHAESFHLTASWLINWFPGVQAPFIMEFIGVPLCNTYLEISKTQTEPKINENITQLQSATENINEIIMPYSPDQALSFVQNLGYHPSEFDMKKFSQWFCNKFLGFTKDKIGFDVHTSKPVCYNYEAFNIYQYLDLHKEYHVEIDHGSFPVTMGTSEWLYDMVNNIYHLLQKSGSFINVQPDSRVRTLLTIKDKKLLSGAENATDINKEIYAISPTWDFYVRSQAYYGNHPGLLQGRFAWCAGHVSIEKGKITFLSNNSGHYLPHVYHFYTFVEELDQKELFAENALLEVARGMKDQSLFSVREFLEGHEKSGLKEAWKLMIQERISKEHVWNYEWLKTILES